MKQFDRVKLLEDRTYKKLMSVLERAKKVRVEGEDWQLIRINPSQEVILQELDLLPKPVQPPKKKPGRPKGSKKKTETVAEEPTKRKRGRPKGSKNKPKDQSVDVSEISSDS